LDYSKENFAAEWRDNGLAELRGKAKVETMVGSKVSWTATQMAALRALKGVQMLEHKWVTPAVEKMGLTMVAKMGEKMVC